MATAKLFKSLSKIDPEVKELKKSQQISNQLAQAVFSRVPQGWKSATVTVRMTLDYAEIISRYLPNSGEKELWFDDGKEGYALFEQLREAMYEEVGAAWYVAILSLTPQGHFRFQYDYDDLSGFNIPPSEEELAEDLKRFPRKQQPAAES